MEINASLQYKRVHLIVPVTTKSFDFLGPNTELAARAGIVLSQSHIEEGPETIEYEIDEALCARGVVREALKAANNGVDAIVIICMGDPALDATREAITNIPVLGLAQTSMHYAKTLGHTFGIAGTAGDTKAYWTKRAGHYGLESSLVAIELADVWVADIHKDAESVTQGLLACFLKMAKAGAEVGILGCGCYQDVDKTLETLLEKEGYPMRVLDAVPLTILQAASMARLGHMHSKIGYPTPPRAKLPAF
jgi:allantoin racemase